MLTGVPQDLAADDFRRTLPRFTGDNLDANLALVDEIRAVAARYDATPGQVALAWVLAQGNDVAPIPGTKRRQLPRGERRRAGAGAVRRRSRVALRS